MTRAIERRWVPAYSLFLLFLSNVLNVADRALLGVVVDPIKADLQLSDTEISIVSGSAFVVFNLVAGLLIARWVDRGNRKLILVIGIAMWSAATAMTGVAQGFSSLAVSRVLVGVGEATAFPVAISMIGDLFTADRRPRAISIYQASIFVGLVLGTILAGVLAAAHGWRAMFLVCGGAGFLVAILLLATLVEPSRSQDAAAGAEAGAMGLNSAIAKLLRARGFVLLSLGAALSTIAGGVLQVWAPTFLLRSHGVSLAAVGALIGPTVGIGGIAGTLLSGVLASQLVRRRGDERGGLLVPLIATPLAAPFYAIFAMAPSLSATMAAAAVMNFLLSMSLPPCIAVAIAIAPPQMRAVSSTLMLLTSGVIGGALGPLLVGAASDAFEPTFGAGSLRYALATMTPIPVIAGLLLWVAYRRMQPISSDKIPAGTAHATSRTKLDA